MFTVFDLLSNPEDSSFKNFSVSEVNEFFKDVHPGFVDSYRILDVKSEVTYSFSKFLEKF